MMKSKNIMLYEILAVLIVFTIVYFFAANKISYAFDYNDVQVLYDNRISMIKKMAKLYGENNIELFEKDDNIYITVKDLVDKGYILPDDENGNLKDPTSEIKLLNDIRIRISNDNGNIKIKILK